MMFNSYFLFKSDNLRRVRFDMFNALCGPYEK